MNKREQISVMILAQLRESLDSAEICLQDSFFEIGVDSISIIRLRQEIEDRCKVDISIEDFVNGNLITIEDLVAAVDRRMSPEILITDIQPAGFTKETLISI